MQFISVTKDNPSHDRGFIAVDAICSAFENRERNNVSIMTMDGFWYDVVDDYEQLYSQVKSIAQNGCIDVADKKSYYRQKKLMPPKTATEIAQRSHEAFMNKEQRPNEVGMGDDVFKRTRKHWTKKPHKGFNVAKNLPTGVGEGHHRFDSEVGKPPLGDGL